MAVSADLAKLLDKAYEDKTLSEVLAASPAALSGLTDAHAEQLKAVLGIDTIAELGSNKYFRAAAALVALQELGGA